MGSQGASPQILGTLEVFLLEFTVFFLGGFGGGGLIFDLGYLYIL